MIDPSDSTQGKVIFHKAAQPGDDVGEGKQIFLSQLEWVAALLLSAIVIFLVVYRTFHAGPLWRDECDALNLARMPTFSGIFHNFQFTAFPLLFPLTVRAYTSLFGTSDIALRCFGLAVGIFFLGVAWFQARTCGTNRGIALVLPALIGLNSNFLFAGLWLRGYGLGSVLIIVAFGSTAIFLLQPGRSRFLAMFVCYLAAMHCLYFNGVLVPTIVLAAAGVLFVRREWKWMSLLLAGAAVCGLTYLPYIWSTYAGTTTWADVLRMQVSWSLLLRQFLAACGGPQLIGAIFWRSIVVICFVGGAFRLSAVRTTNQSRERDMLLFGLLTIPVSIVVYCGFLGALSTGPAQRYFLALVCLIAAATAHIAANINGRYWTPWGRFFLIALAIGSVPLAPWEKIHQRNSNMDAVAQRLDQEALPDELIVVNQAALGISFNRYYHGKTRWMTLPAIEDHKFHRYDLLRRKMTEFFPLDDVEQNTAAILKSGKRVWIVGSVGQPGDEQLILTPAPDPKYGWQWTEYARAWTGQFRAFLQKHALRVQPVIRSSKGVSEWENPQLIICEGWK